MLIDAHTHYSLPVTAKNMIDIMDATGVDAANLALVPHRRRVSSVPDALMAKAQYPGRFYVFASFDVSEYFRHAKDLGRHMAGYVKRMLECGCDGLKIIEGKPTMRKMLPVPDFDAPVWEPFWAYAEKTELPILWHLNDPEEFWDKDRIPQWASIKGWYYDGSYVNNEEQYRQVLAVLERHPKLCITFAHFFFLSAQLERLADIMRRYVNLRVDLTPGIEMYVNLSRDTDAARRFFNEFADRIIYGTDMGARSVLAQDVGEVSLDESRERAAIVQGFLEKTGDIYVEGDGDYLIGREGFTIRGLGLGKEALEKIYAKNFLAFAGEKPKTVNALLTVAECRRIKRVMRVMSLFDKEVEKDFTCANSAIKYFKTKE